MGKYDRTRMLEEILKRMGDASKRVVYVNLSDQTMAFLIPGLPDYHPEFSYELATSLDSIYWHNGICASLDTERLISLEELSEAIQIPVQWLGLYSAMIHFYLGKTRDIKGFEDIRKNYESIVQKHMGTRNQSRIIRNHYFPFLVETLQFLVFSDPLCQNQIARHQEILRQIQNNQDFISRKSAFLSGVELN
ncbi:MAG: hypothetical protein R3B93_23095 [Bacteroidia bacterium]